MDDLIVIILTLVIAGIGIFGQLKKKKQSTTKTEGSNAPDSFWDLIQGESNSPNQMESEFDESEFVAESDYTVQKPEVNIKKQGYQFTAKNEGRSVLSNDLKTETKKPKLKSKLKKDFSLRKAVIYSEILNRKYT